MDTTRLNAVLVGKLIGRAAQFATGFVLAQRLGVTAFGLYALGYTLFKLVGTALAPLGLPNAVLRYGADGDLWVHRRALRLVTGSVALWMLACLWLAGPLAQRVFGEPGLVRVMVGFVLALPGLVLLGTAGASARVLERVDVAVWAEDIVQPILALGLVLLWPDLSSADAAHILAVSYTVAALPPLGLVLLWPHPPMPHAASPALLPYALVTMLYMTLMLGIQWIDRLLVGVLFTVADVGLYQAASQVSAIFAVIITVEVAVLAPQLSRLFTSGDHATMNTVYQSTTLWGFKLSLAVYLLILASPSLLLTVAYGPAYRGAAPLLVVMATAQLVNIVTGACATLMLVTAQQRRLAMIYGAAVLLNLTLSLGFARVMGPLGIAVGTGIALAFATLAVVYSSQRTLGIFPVNERFLLPALATAASGVALVGAGWWGGGFYRGALGLGLAAVAVAWALYPDLRRVLIQWVS